jgi:hypothetical protein
MFVAPRVVGPHAGKRLANGEKGRFHGARLDRVMIGGKGPGAVTLGKHLEDGKAVGHIGEKGVDTVVGTLIGPEKPGSGSGLGSGRNDAGVEHLHSSAIVSAELMASLRGQRVQGRACG